MCSISAEQGETGASKLQLSTQPRPRVLVLLAAFNGARWIERQVRSILEQADVDVHLSIRDDGSNDDTRQLLENLRDAGRIQISYAPSASGSAAQNFFALIRATKADSFDFVAFADQDDEWCTDKLRRGCSILRESGSSGYSSSVVAVWEDGAERLLSQSHAQTRGDFLFEGAGQG
ncbi:MAG TPA: glycosyltransferase, partial [Steroidobacter sp.]|nr:glycosyltransferase [Steroidobacter sp.]